MVAVLKIKIWIDWSESNSWIDWSESNSWIDWSESNSWIYFYIVLNKNWKITGPNKVYLAGPEDWSSSWWMWLSCISYLFIVSLFTCFLGFFCFFLVRCALAQRPNGHEVAFVICETLSSLFVPRLWCPCL